jgi:hypothetical protein
LSFLFEYKTNIQFLILDFLLFMFVFVTWYI